MKPLTPRMREVLAHVAAGHDIYGQPRPYPLKGLSMLVAALRHREYINGENRITDAGRAALEAVVERTGNLFGEEES